jgi:hypothetical protein
MTNDAMATANINAMSTMSNVSSTTMVDDNNHEARHELYSDDKRP